MQNEDLTPMLSQYHTIKKKHPDCLLFFRLGDFYELFYEDAVVGSRELGIVLTSRPTSKDKDRIPMCGVPYHSAHSYIQKLVNRGYKIAICEQLEPADAVKGKGVVKRDVIRIITPGTYFESERNFAGLSCVIRLGGYFYCSYINLSIGDFLFGKFKYDEFKEFLLKFQPSEILLQTSLDIPIQAHKTLLEDEFFNEGLKHLKEDFNIPSARSIGFDDEKVLLPCAGAYYYVKVTQKSFLPFIKRPKLYTQQGYVRIDYKARRGLELLENIEGKENLSLFGVIDRTLTPMGRRLLKFRILHPYNDIKTIQNVQLAVEELYQNTQLLKGIRTILEGMPDLEKLVARISSGLSTPRDYVQLKIALFKVEELLKFISSQSVESEYLRRLYRNFENPLDIAVEIDRVLVEDPPIHVKEGGLIKDGVNEELDKLRHIKDNGESILREYEEKLRKETGVQSLKIGYNKVIGYYIEVTRPNLRYVPSYFRRRQTLSNAERFTTSELQNLEEKILSAYARIKDIEYEIFVELRNYVLRGLNLVAKVSQNIGELDYLCSLAKIALEKGWIKPHIVKEKLLYIKDGIHPVISEFVKDYVPNSVYMDDDNLLLILTGPNMAGKSSYIRQVALICILAHMGSFVPAKEAKIGIISSIFSRIGSGDILALGISTFMNEMLDVANILNNADEKSLIILDEIGRGTSTYDGISITWAVCEYILENIKARTLLATHFLEITDLEKEYPQVKNYHMQVRKSEGVISFLYTLTKGRAESSFGINVAKMAGLPQEVINRSYQILVNLCGKHDQTIPYLEKVYQNSKGVNEERLDLTEEILEKLKNLDLNNMTPIQAMMFLVSLKELVESTQEHK